MMKKILILVLLFTLLMSNSIFAEEKLENIEVRKSDLVEAQIDWLYSDMTPGDDVQMIEIHGENIRLLLNQEVKLIPTKGIDACYANGVVKYDKDFDYYYIKFELLEGRSIKNKNNYKIEFTSMLPSEESTLIITKRREARLINYSTKYLDTSGLNPEYVDLRVIGYNLIGLRSIEVYNDDNMMIERWNTSRISKKDGYEKISKDKLDIIRLKIQKEKMLAGKYRLEIKTVDETLKVSNIESDYRFDLITDRYMVGSHMKEIIFELYNSKIARSYEVGVYEKIEDRVDYKKSLIESSNISYIYNGAANKLTFTGTVNLKDTYNEGRGLKSDSEYVFQFKKGVLVFRDDIEVSNIVEGEFLSSRIRSVPRSGILPIKINPMDESMSLDIQIVERDNPDRVIATGQIIYNEGIKMHVVSYHLVKGKSIIKNQLYTLKGVSQEIKALKVQDLDLKGY